MALFSKENFSREGIKKFAASARDTIKKRWWVMLIELIALAVLLVADLVSKKFVVEFLLAQPAQSYKLIPGFIHLTYSENTGAGFGMLSGNTTLLIVVTFIVIIGLTIFLIFAQKQNEWLRASLLLIVGGGIGNLVDRLGLGYVRDFIEYAFLKNFAICNVADVFVTVGAVMLIIVLIVMLVKEGRKNQKEFEKEQAGKPQEEAQDPLDAPININPMLASPNDYKFDEGATSAEKSDADNAKDEYASNEEKNSQTAESSQHPLENDENELPNEDIEANGADGSGDVKESAAEEDSAEKDNSEEENDEDSNEDTQKAEDTDEDRQEAKAVKEDRQEAEEGAETSEDL